MVLARKVSGDYGLYNTWAWNSDYVERPWAYTGNVTGPPGALLFDVKPEIALKESLELQF